MLKRLERPRPPARIPRLGESLNADIRGIALGLLARREHSHTELLQKLQRKFGFQGESALGLIPAILEELQSNNYQSDSRFAESYVTYRTRSGKGPLRIIQELRERGVSEDLIEALVISEDESWYMLASDIAQRRFGESHSFADIDSKMKFRAKQMRFLQYRGFTFEQIKKAIYH